MSQKGIWPKVLKIIQAVSSFVIKQGFYVAPNILLFVMSREKGEHHLGTAEIRAGSKLITAKIRVLTT